ncbi:unnamed protein product [Triticum turgidum subsp. durum]|uniref:glutaminase n=1 Tax=Triticum turgidum subsp. durum TaxID=4567 RepID=A0A9R0TE27_TRITD|nr:unnamed protein product [Triticum turgidum subsp. durum]
MAVVGVLALQGSYNEHMSALRRIGVKGVEVRKPEQLHGLDSLIIPGGESTAMAKLANYHNLFPALREFVGAGKPVWGTCAGLIFLANKAVGQKLGGQELVGGLDCTVHRNFFGSQLQSFETELSVPMLAEKEGGSNTCRGVFIRAPAILEVGSDVEILAECPVPSGRPSITIPSAEGVEMCVSGCSFYSSTLLTKCFEKYYYMSSGYPDGSLVENILQITLSLLCTDLQCILPWQEEVYSKDRVIVAVRQGNILATAFHPELTSDCRWHRFFLDMDRESHPKAFSALSLSSSSRGSEGGSKTKPFDLPIFE